MHLKPSRTSKSLMQLYLPGPARSDGVVRAPQLSWRKTLERISGYRSSALVARAHLRARKTLSYLHEYFGGLRWRQT